VARSAGATFVAPPWTPAGGRFGRLRVGRESAGQHGSSPAG